MSAMMESALRNFPKPPLAVIHGDCGLSARTDIVAQICNRTNEITEYVYGLETVQLLVPAQGNVDERMPLRFLRPCIQTINEMIYAFGMEDNIPPIPMPGDNMDYHRFVPLAREITETLNAVVEAL